MKWQSSFETCANAELLNSQARNSDGKQTKLPLLLGSINEIIGVFFIIPEQSEVGTGQSLSAGELRASLGFILKEVQTQSCSLFRIIV